MADNTEQQNEANPEKVLSAWRISTLKVQRKKLEELRKTWKMHTLDLSTAEERKWIELSTYYVPGIVLGTFTFIYPPSSFFGRIMVFILTRGDMEAQIF